VRPLKLSLQGFKSHESLTEFDFSERTLFAIVGPTGAGKTTVLDGIAFALYAKTPKVQRSTKSLICTTKDSAEIELVFDSEGRTYTINRAIRRTGAAVHVLTDDAGEKVTGEAAVTAAIEDILMLDFNAFRSSVLLAQNQFDEFFNATPDTRMRILKGVFRFDQLDKMRDAARDHRNAHELEASKIEGGLKEIPEDAAEQIATTKEAIAALDLKIAALAKVGPQEQKLMTRLGSTDEDLEKASTLVDELEALADDLPDAKVMQNLIAANEQIAAPLEKVRKRIEELKADHNKAKSTYADLEKKLGKEMVLAGVIEKARRLGSLQTSLADSKAKIAAAKAELKTAEKTNTTALTAEVKAAQALEKVEQERVSLHATHAAHGLRQHLGPGDPCPVCEQTIKTVPKGKEPAAFKTIDDRVAAAKTAAQGASAAVRAAGEALTSAKHELSTTERSLGELQEEATTLDGEVIAVIGKATDPLGEVEKRKTSLQEAREAVERLESDLNEASEELQGFEETELKVKEIRDAAYDDLVHIASVLKRPRLDRKAAVDELAKASETFSALIDAQLREANKKLVELGDARGALEKEIATLHAEAGLAPGDTVEIVLAAAQENRGALNTTIKQLQDAIERSKELVDQLKTVKEQIGVYETLFSDLANTKFVDFLLEDKRRMLSELASAQLFEMSGRYRFDDEGTFKVIDGFNADSQRGVDSLSGGETFLASLSLALGLAESVTRHGGRLQCFFLDEGFGSLDPDSLQKALDGIERIATHGRLIGLVSHVQGVSERVVDKIELDRDEDGMTIVKEKPGPTLRVVS
jgi:exonuclease SbcC